MPVEKVEQSGVKGYRWGKTGKIYFYTTEQERKAALQKALKQGYAVTHDCCIVDEREKRIDPTRTTTIRKMFEREIRKRFRRLKGLVNQSIIGNNALDVGASRIGDAALQQNAFAFRTSSDKIQNFLAWLKEREKEGIFELMSGDKISKSGNDFWASTYIKSSYQKGLEGAEKGLVEAGAKVKPSFLRSSFDRPIHADRVGLAYTRIFNELEGITSAMDRQISEVLAQGIVEGVGPLQIARRINKTIDKIGVQRSLTLARTEVIRANAEASLNMFEEAKVYGVQTQSEWSTAGDDRVCPLCKPMEGKVFKLEEARGMIPRHVNCRCVWKPVVVGGTGIELS